MVVFTSAADAVRCAVEMQRATTGAAGGLPVGIGLDAGEPLSEGDDLYGTPVIVASRLCDAAGDGEVLASEVVRRVAGPRVTALMRPAGAMRFKVFSEPVTVANVQWRLVERDLGSESPQPSDGPRCWRRAVIVSRG
jgi:class 3 adenylate cyclase